MVRGHPQEILFENLKCTSSAQAVFMQGSRYCHLMAEMLQNWRLFNSLIDCLIETNQSTGFSLLSI